MSWTDLNNQSVDLKNRVIDIAKNPNQIFTGINSDLPYPGRYVGSGQVNRIKPDKWNKLLPYGFSVVKYSNPTIRAFGFKSFKLPINPTELHQDDKFSINITPTQDAVVSEHNGIVFKELVISGTTGIHPGRGVFGSNSKGKSVLQTGDKQKSGYVLFQELRNYLRAYAEHKKNSINNEDVLIFENKKDNEALVVEPVNFRMDRMPNKGNLYFYNITLRVIGNVKFRGIKLTEIQQMIKDIDNIIANIHDGLDFARGVVAGASDLLNKLEREINNTIIDPLRKFDLLVSEIGGLGNNLSHFANNIIGRLSNTFLGSILTGVFAPDIKKQSSNPRAKADQGSISVITMSYEDKKKNKINEDNLPPNVAEEFKKEKEDIVNNTTKKFFQDLRDNLEKLRDNAADSFGLGDEEYNEYVQRSQTFVPDETKQTTDKEYEILYGLERAIKSIDLFVAFNPDFFLKDIDESFQESEALFNNEIESPVPSSVKEVIVPPNKSIEDIAYEHLGDYSRWHEIVIMNNLIPPYIDDDFVNDRVKNPGDKIIVPDGANINETESITVSENKINKNLTQLEKNLGIDLALSNSFDLILNNNGDFKLSYGLLNARQAIRILINTERGELKYHPQFGIGIKPGEKNTFDANDIYDDISQAILSDPRFSNFTDPSIIIEGSSIIINGNINIANSNISAPLSLYL